MLAYAHFFWSGSHFLYADYLAVLSALRVHQPGQVFVWCKSRPRNNPFWAMLRRLPKVRIRTIDRYQIPCSNIYILSDYVRYRVLYDYGGLYADFDTVSLRPFAENLQRDVLVGEEQPGLINIAVIAAKARSPFLRSLIAAAEARRNVKDTLSGPFNLIGPPFFTRFCQRHPDLVQVLPPPAFYAVHWKHWPWIWDNRRFPRRALMLHYWGKFARQRASQVHPGQREKTIYHRAASSVLGEDW